MEYLEVGKIVNTHGIKGEVRVQSVTNQAEIRYQAGNTLKVMLKDGKEKMLTVKTHRQHKSFDLITFEEITSIAEAETWIGAQLYVAIDQLNEVPEDEHYVHELIGMQVVQESGEVIGSLKEILFYPANDVWVVSRKNQKDLLLPAISEVIRSVDYATQTITIHLMEGLDPDED